MKGNSALKKVVNFIVLIERCDEIGDFGVLVLPFSRPKSSQRPYDKITLWLKGKPIDEVDFHKILGTVLDNQLSFEAHFQQVVSRGYGVLQSNKSFGTENRIPCTTPFVTLYKTLVRNIIDFSPAAIANISSKSLSDVSTLERSSMLLG